MDIQSRHLRAAWRVALAAAFGLIFSSTCLLAASPRDSFVLVEYSRDGSSAGHRCGVTVFHDKKFAYILTNLNRLQKGKPDTRSYQARKVGSDRKTKAQRSGDGMFLRIPVGEAPAPLPSSMEEVKVSENVRIIKLGFNKGEDGELVTAYSEMEAVVKAIYYDLDGKLGSIAIEGKGIAGAYPAVIVKGDGAVVGVVRAPYASRGYRSRPPDPRAVAVRHALPMKGIVARIQAASAEEK